MREQRRQQILGDFQYLGSKVSKLLREKQRSVKMLTMGYKDEVKSRGVFSEADYAAEEMILAYLEKKYPDILILSEERAHQESITRMDYGKFQEAPFCFVIDPIDGTRNFIHGIDYYCVSMALMERGKPVVGFVIRPTPGESFWGIQGLGSWYKVDPQTPETKLSVEPLKGSLKSCLVATGLPLNTSQVRKNDIQVGAVRRMGSAALDICYVAAGKFHAHFSRGLSPWDLAAAALIAHEAGVRVGNADGNDIDCFARTFLAAHEGLYERIQKNL